MTRAQLAKKANTNVLPGRGRIWTKWTLPFLREHNSGQGSRATGSFLGRAQARACNIAGIHPQIGDPLSPCNEMFPYYGLDTGPPQALLSDRSAVCPFCVECDNGTGRVPGLGAVRSPCTLGTLLSALLAPRGGPLTSRSRTPQRKPRLPPKPVLGDLRARMSNGPLHPDPALLVPG